MAGRRKTLRGREKAGPQVRMAEAAYRPIAGGFSNMDNSKQKTTKTARPAATII